MRSDAAATAFILDDFLPYRLAVLAERLSRTYGERYKARYGLSRAEWRVLAHLSQHSAVSVREIHRKAEMDKSKVSRAAARLETAGFVTKQTSRTDKRLVELSLTPEGIDLMADLGAIAAEFNEMLVDSLGDAAATFSDGINRLLDAACDPASRGDQP